MTPQLSEKINDLDDRKAIRILEFYAARLFEGIKTSPQEMLDGIPAELKAQAPFEQVLKMSGKERTRPLPEGESARIAKEILAVFAKDPAFAPSLAQALEEYRDDKLLVGEILATGTALSMVIVAATTTLEVTIGKVKVKKTTASADLIKSIAELVIDIKKHIP